MDPSERKGDTSRGQAHRKDLPAETSGSTVRDGAKLTQENPENDNAQGGGSQRKTRAPPHTDLNVHFTAPSKKQLEDLERMYPGCGEKAREIHDQRAREYAAEHCPDATRANIRKISHPGGTNPEEAEHATISFKGSRRIDGKAVHLYMDLLALLGIKE
ncbi:uncharacterized protein PHACADRAFT_214555 [Phanerochaete carnosa HHB-10118-sp]|uniref:Uncharacterized protein n=1 Tax=Phanerochaete carnosa (strain HHB-10118-sp) TaxID=650164 RepID=K5WFM9_PHACS|nr:uncharacterized protein PHACADRAFT_214555 [Phanerochaete carnosa HHB-10118-sp]EKM48992.1 hypothetical protein PHACADRAFT_214555 [Phanerochaete carnosa HHB-10118-sp]